jgi:nucleoid-associated protein YgaU
MNMAKNIFEQIVENLNKPPFPTESYKQQHPEAAKPTAAPAAAKPAAPAPAAKPADQQPAEDLQDGIRLRDAELKAAQAEAENAELKKQLEEMRGQLNDLRRQYETEMAKQAQVHAESEEWTYTVKPGDTLSHIALHFYGKAGRWPEIAAANKDKVPNPNLIYPGQVLIIPGVNKD